MKWLKKIKLTKKKLVILGIILLLVAGFFVFKGRSKKDVSSTTVQKGTVREELILTGAVKADKHAILSFPSAGKISAIHVKEGQKVYKGQALVSLDKTVLNATYQQALNNYRKYQAEAENALDLVKDHSSDETFAQKASRTDAEVARDNAYDAMVSAKYSLDNATIYAPFTGTVSSLNFSSVGVNVLATDTIVEVVDPESIYFEAEADQSEVTSVKENQEVVVVLDSLSDREIKGTVEYIGLTPKIGEAGTIYKIRVKIDKKELGAARVGMTGDGKFVLSQKEDVLYVPFEYINTDKDGKFVYEGKPGNKVYVETGLEGEETVEVVKGLSEGDVLYD